jgi:putative membrane protein
MRGVLAAYAGSVKALPAASRAMLATLLVGVVLANIRQPFPEIAPLQHIPTLVLIGAAPMLLLRWPISTANVRSLWLFWMLHTLGGRYIYSYVPYDAWAEELTGGTLSAAMGWTRNHYDRMIHFAFGLLWTVPVARALAGRHGLRSGFALFTAFAVIGLCSALYECFEWALTIVAAGDTADYYNGQQGDLWDAQKDMALAQAGSAVAILLSWVRAR